MVDIDAIKVGDSVKVEHAFLESVAFVGKVNMIFPIGEYFAITIETLTDAIVTVTTKVYVVSMHKKES